MYFFNGNNKKTAKQGILYKTVIRTLMGLVHLSRLFGLYLMSYSLQTLGIEIQNSKGALVQKSSVLSL